MYINNTQSLSTKIGVAIVGCILAVVIILTTMFYKVTYNIIDEDVVNKELSLATKVVSHKIENDINYEEYKYLINILSLLFKNLRHLLTIHKPLHGS